MTAVTHPIAEHLAPAQAVRQGGTQSFGWLGTGCRLSLLGVLVVMHLPMLIFIGVVCAAGAVLGKRK